MDPATKGNKRKRYLPHNKPVKKKGSYPLRPGVQGFFITCDGGREHQASREALNIIDSRAVAFKESRDSSGKIKINPRCPHQMEGIEYDERLRRRLKRRSIANKMVVHATRTNVGNCGNAVLNTLENSGRMAEEVVDEDYKFFLDNLIVHSDVFMDNNVDDFHVDDITSHNDDSDVFMDNNVDDFDVDDITSHYDISDDWDPQYKMFFENLRVNGNSYAYEVFVDNQLFLVKYEGREERKLDDLSNSEVLCDSVDEDYQLFLSSSRIEGDCLVYTPERAATTKNVASAFEENSLIVGQNLQVTSQESEPPNRRQSSDDCHSSKHKCNSEVLSDIVDEDYQLFLNHVERVGDSLVYMPKKGVKVAYEEQNDQSSSDSELIILEPNQYDDENSPFISSKRYDSSCPADVRNHKDSMAFYAFDSSYRKGLMEKLERPYDQNEYDTLLQKATHQRPKERHRETRHGIKSCPISGVTKSYLDLYSDLARTIDEVKEPHRVLFLLRGFFYWMENVTQEGVFRPWLDASCWEKLKKM